MPATQFPQIMTPGQMQMNLANGLPAHTPGATPWGNNGGMAGSGPNYNSTNAYSGWTPGPAAVAVMRAQHAQGGGTLPRNHPLMEAWFAESRQNPTPQRTEPFRNGLWGAQAMQQALAQPQQAYNYHQQQNDAPTQDHASLQTRFDPRGRGANYNPYSTDASAMGQPGGATNWLIGNDGSQTQQRDQNQGASYRQQPNGYTPGGLAPPMQSTATQPVGGQQQIRTPQLGYTPGAMTPPPPAQQPAAPQSGLMAPRTPQPKMPGGIQKRY